MRLLEKFLDKIRKGASEYGYTCDGCGDEIFSYPSERLCKGCQGKIKQNDGHVCDKCGRAAKTDGVCLDCKGNLPNFTRGFAPFVYRNEAAALVNRMKNGNPRLALYFGGRPATADLLRR